MARVNGIVFVIDQKQSDVDPAYLPEVIYQILNLVANYFTSPITIVVNQREGHKIKTKLDKSWFESEVFSIADRQKKDYEVFELDLKSLTI